VNYSDVREISCYIPQVLSKEFSYPLVVSCVDDVSTSLFEWKDPDKSHDYYNVMQDASVILYGNGSKEVLPPNVFSKVYHYPPKDKMDEFDGNVSKDSVTSTYARSRNPGSFTKGSKGGGTVKIESDKSTNSEFDRSLDLNQFQS